MADLPVLLKNLPENPGVYMMKDRAGEVIYVGKARSLKNRVRSYFVEAKDRTPRISLMIGQIADIDIIITETEMEALILEFTLIRKYRPYFNVRFKDDKRYPLLEVTLDDELPRIRIVRRTTGKRNRVFGPYTSTDALRKTLNVMRHVFQIRTCKNTMLKRGRPCLNYQIAQCCGPCANLISKEEYRKRIDSAMLFLSGHSSRLLKTLRKEMEEESEKLNYERCGRILSSIQSIEQIMQRQKVLFSHAADRDFIAFCSAAEAACVEVMMVREGKLTGELHFIIDTPPGMSDEEKARSFIMGYYQRGSSPPPQVYLSGELQEKELLEEWLSSAAGKKVRLITHVSGQNRQILEMAMQNAAHHLSGRGALQSKADMRSMALLEVLRNTLPLRKVPDRIEAYDISNIMGTHATGSMVVFSGGEPHKGHYRRFRIKSKETPDDIHMMQEMLSRRFTADPEGKNSWKLLMPDLVVIDGGAGQLRAARQVLDGKGIDIPLISLAKRNEEVYFDPQKLPLIIDKDSPALHLLQHLRDESHRFALAYHRKLRAKAFGGGGVDAHHRKRSRKV